MVLRTLMLCRRCFAVLSLCGLASAGELFNSGDLNELGRFDLETLLDLEVTSVSKKEEKLADSPAAVYVITQEEIRRSGLSTLPELFRMVPGMQVARVNAGQWAISARGFNDSIADKLLVLVDGRSVYTHSFGGVFWIDQDLVLEDIDRIEVIRGPGATLWGANAVNGVINVITRSAKNTQGLLLATTFGTLEQPSTSLRYGGKLSETLHYRFSAKYFNHEDFERADGLAIGDDWRRASGGLRLDWDASESDLVTLQAGYFNGTVGERYRKPLLQAPFETEETANNHNSGGHVLGRWTHTFSLESELSLQGYYDRIDHREFGIDIQEDTFDLEFQHQLRIAERNEIV